MNHNFYKWFFSLVLLILVAGFTRIVQAQINDVPFYSQLDQDWANQDLGNSNLTIGGYGCGLTSASMVLSSYDINITPRQLNDNLKKAKAFSGPLLVWGDGNAWTNATYGNQGGSLKGTTVYWTFDEEVLKDNISHGRPVIVFLNNQHYVVVTSYKETRDQKSNKINTEYFINDPWKKDYNEGHSISFEDNAVGVTKPSEITQMVILNTDSNLPTTGILVDWPAIQDKYSVMGGLRSVLGAPTADDVVTEGLLPLGTHRTQTFKGGKIYAYNYGQWRAYWLPTELAKEYDRLSNPGRLPEEQFGDLSYDAYPISVGEGMAVRADAENGSLIWYKPSGKIDVLTPKLNISAEYYNNTSLSGYPDVNRLEKNIQFTWGSGSPHPLISSEGFSARYSETINIMLPGLHTFYAWTDGGVRITLDGDLILDRWNNTIAGKFSGTKLTGIGDHKLVYEYRHTQGNSRFWAAYAPAGVQIAWAGEDTQGAYNSLPAMAPGFTPSQLNFIESIKQQIQAWWDEQSGSIRGSLEAWWNTLVNDVKQRTETWATEQWNKMVEQIRQYIETWVSEEWQKFLQTTAQDLSIWLNQICAGVFVLIALPFAMVAMHKQRG